MLELLWPSRQQARICLLNKRDVMWDINRLGIFSSTAVGMSGFNCAVNTLVDCQVGVILLGWIQQQVWGSRDSDMKFVVGNLYANVPGKSKGKRPRSVRDCRHLPRCNEICFFGDFMPRRLVVYYWRFGTTYRSHIQSSSNMRRIFHLELLEPCKYGEQFVPNRR